MNPPDITAWTGEGYGYASVTKPLNVRDDPDLSALVVAVLPPGAQVIVWCARGPWFLVGPAGRPTGWAHSDYLAPA